MTNEEKEAFWGACNDGWARQNVVIAFCNATGCCGYRRKGPFCNSCGTQVDPGHGLLAYILDRLDDMHRTPTARGANKIEMWESWRDWLAEKLVDESKQ